MIRKLSISLCHMPRELKKEIEIELAHVVFLDMVCYSKLSVNVQIEEG